MNPALTRFRIASVLTFLGATAVLGCNRSSPPPSNAEAGTAGSMVASAPASDQYNPAITVFKDPT